MGGCRHGLRRLRDRLLSLIHNGHCRRSLRHRLDLLLGLSHNSGRWCSLLLPLRLLRLLHGLRHGLLRGRRRRRRLQLHDGLLRGLRLQLRVRGPPTGAGRHHRHAERLGRLAALGLVVWEFEPRELLAEAREEDLDAVPSHLPPDLDLARRPGACRLLLGRHEAQELRAKQHAEKVLQRLRGDFLQLGVAVVAAPLDEEQHEPQHHEPELSEALVPLERRQVLQEELGHQRHGVPHDGQRGAAVGHGACEHGDQLLQHQPRPVRPIF
mmetsp:Transcript_119400/g.385499  ORF Transcript_119400/g.385499 Transcript_119400/m.385499 type:complete len:268 (-) Transcript_119400:3311-4114(-)